MKNEELFVGVVIIKRMEKIISKNNHSITMKNLCMNPTTQNSHQGLFKLW